MGYRKQHGRTPARQTWLRLLIAVALLASGAMVANVGGALTGNTPLITNFGVYGDSFPQDIVAASGNLWFTDNGLPDIGRVTPTGDIQEFGVSGAQTPGGIALGSDGNLYFTDSGASAIGVAKNLGGVPSTHEYDCSSLDCFPTHLVTAAGFLWVSDQIGPTSTGAVNQYSLSNGVPTFVRQITLDLPAHGVGATGCGLANDPESIIVGPDGNLWVAESGTGRLAVIGNLAGTPSVIHQYPTSTPNACGEGIHDPFSLAANATNVYYTDGVSGVGYLTPGNPPTLAFTDVAATGVSPNASFSGTGNDIVVGTNGFLYLADDGNGSIDAMTPDLLGFDLFQNTKDSEGKNILPSPVGITNGPAGTIWFTDQGSVDDATSSHDGQGGFIGRFAPPATPPPATTTTTGGGTTTTTSGGGTTTTTTGGGTTTSTTIKSTTTTTSGGGTTTSTTIKSTTTTTGGGTTSTTAKPTTTTTSGPTTTTTQPAGTGTLIGTVTNALTGKTVSGATVAATCTAGSCLGHQSPKSTITSGNGKFTLGPLVFGTYTLTTTGPQGSNLLADTHSVTVAASNPVLIIPLQTAKGSITGTVRNGASGVNNVSVVATCANSSICGISSGNATTNGAGQYTILNLPAGPYDMTATPPIGLTGDSARGVMVQANKSTTQDFNVGVVPSGSIRAQLAAVALALQPFSSDHKVADAIRTLNKANDDRLWLSNGGLDPHAGHKAFNLLSKAAHDLLEAKTGTPSVLVNSLGTLVNAARSLATMAINQAGAAGANGKQLGKATKAFTRGQALVTEGKLPEAIKQFGDAWKAAEKLAFKNHKGAHGNGNH